jgi:hypothetical protein
MAREYILYEWRPSGRPFPPSARPTWPPPRLKQGPYWVEQTEHGLRCTPRRGTYAYKRMIQQQEKKKQSDEVGWFFIWCIAAFALGALALHFL